MDENKSLEQKQLPEECYKEMFFKISQKLLQNTCVEVVSILIKLQVSGSKLY